MSEVQSVSTKRRREIAEQAARIAAPVFARNGWTYGKGRTPDAPHLMSTILSLLDKVGEDCEWLESGRFRVHRILDGDLEEITVALVLSHGYGDE